MEETIIFNECFNDEGKHIHLYRDEEPGMWTAYGYSAYRVAEMGRRDGMPVVTNYSAGMQMPVVILGNDACRHMAALCRKEEQTPNYTRLSVPEIRPADPDGYRDWARELRETSNMLII